MLTGRRLLIAVLQRTTGREVAARCHVHETSVGKWLAGLTTPSVEHRRQLAAMYRIPPSAWERMEQRR